MTISIKHKPNSGANSNNSNEDISSSNDQDIADNFTNYIAV